MQIAGNKLTDTIDAVCFLSSEMVNLDSYDSEGPLTPETDDSEVSSVESPLICPFLSTFPY